jgi:Domain of unknown function (DUF1902)
LSSGRFNATDDSEIEIREKLQMTTLENSLRAIIRVLWDAEAEVWVATSDDMIGLVAEAETFDQLVDDVKGLAPELIALNGRQFDMPLALHFLADRMEQVAA